MADRGTRHEPETPGTDGAERAWEESTPASDMVPPPRPPLPTRTRPQNTLERELPAVPEHSEAPPIPPRKHALPMAEQRQPPPIPARRETMPSRIEPLAHIEHISTPPPLARYEPGPADPTEGTYGTLKEEPAIRPPTHAKFNLETPRNTPAPVHRGGFHRSVNSLPANVPLVSAPPGSEQLLATPSAPPMTERIPTFSSMGHRGSDIDLSDEPQFLSRQATPSEDVRSAALDDARENMGRAMFSDRVLNFRDLGVSVMRAARAQHQSRVRAERVGPMPGVVFRSAEVGSAGEHDVKTLFSKYGIRTIIDLRSELEARASDILTTHYPSSMQPTADQSVEKLMRLRTTQLRNTIVEVAAHDYEAAARPWERTGESRSSWTRRNSLRYSRSVGDPQNDPLARALAHLYDDPDSDTQTVGVDRPYMPREPESEPEHGAESGLAGTPQHPGLAQTAYDWGSETLQMLRSYWDYSWNGAERKSEPPEAPLPPLPDPHDSTNDSTRSSSTDSFYHNHAGDAGREPLRYGLRPVSHAEHTWPPPPPQIVVDATEAETETEADMQTGSSKQQGLPRATTEPSLTRLACHHRNQLSNSETGTGVRKPRVVNRFGGARTRFRCNVIGENYRKKCVWAHAPLSTKIKVVLRFATFNKAEAIRTIGREVLAPRGLGGSYEDYVDYCKEEFAAVLRIFADPCAYPVLFHCQHGKDRTGIVAMLLLGILGVDDRIIAEDYALSEKCLAPVRQRMELLDMGAVGLPSAFCESPAPVMLRLLHHIRASYGSIHGYLHSAGLSDQEINTIAWCLRGNFCGIAPRHTHLSPLAAESGSGTDGSS